jgi:Ca2+/Na+ antiporter
MTRTAVFAWAVRCGNWFGSNILNVPLLPFGELYQLPKLYNPLASMAQLLKPRFKYDNGVLLVGTLTIIIFAVDCKPPIVFDLWHGKLWRWVVGFHLGTAV